MAQRAGGWHVEVTGVLTGGVEFAENVEMGGSAQRAGWDGDTGGGCAEAGGRSSGDAEGGWSIWTIGLSNPNISVLTFRYHI